MYLIYKGSGGLFHNLRGLTKAMELAERHEKVLLIDMASHSAFKIPFSDFFDISHPDLKHTESYNTLSVAVSQEFQKATATYSKKGYTIQGEVKSKVRNLDFDQDIEYYAGSSRSHQISPYIQIKKSIMVRLEEEVPLQNYIALHFRNTDLGNKLKPFIRRLKSTVKKTGIRKVYLASDDFHAFDEIRAALPEVELIRKTVPGTGIENLHYRSPDKEKEIYEAIRDCYYILQSDYFIPSKNSSYSLCLMEMIKSGQTFFPDMVSSTKIV